MRNPRACHRISGQHGAALVVGLILLLILTVLGVSGMSMSVNGLTMANNAQTHQNAFQAAETGIEISLDLRNYSTSAGASLPNTDLGNGVWTTATVTYADCTIAEGFSAGEGGGTIQAFHFDIVADGTVPGENAASRHNQSFYVVASGGCP